MKWKPCLESGCPELAPRGKTRCEEHDLGPWHHSKTFEERFGLTRSQWQRLRRRVLRRDYETCNRCGASPARQVDHIVPRADGGGNALSNLQTLCDVCHTVKTREDRRRRSRS